MSTRLTSRSPLTVQDVTVCSATNALRGLVRSIVPYRAIYPYGYINRLDVLEYR